jgi:heme exporter protein D
VNACVIWFLGIANNACLIYGSYVWSIVICLIQGCIFVVQHHVKVHKAMLC